MDDKMDDSLPFKAVDWFEIRCFFDNFWFLLASFDLLFDDKYKY